MTETKTPPDLATLGWRSFFARQIEIEEHDKVVPMRVTAVHRSALHLCGPQGDQVIPPLENGESDAELAATVGDWLLIDAPDSDGPPARPRLLDRFSLFRRRAPGSDRQVQLIAANIDTLFIVTSCNQDFNIARLERYLALARDADVTPVVILTKADLTDAVETYTKEARSLMRDLLVEAINAKDTEDVRGLLPWCGKGQTVAFVGSSGVGKSTLINALSGADRAETAAIRDDDARGRHTTTHRQLHALPGGGWLVDTPGMRELQLTDARDGLDEVFADISELAADCKFNDCAHESEPGCAVTAAIDRGELERKRVQRWKKLLREDADNTKSLTERRRKEKGLAKTIRSIQKARSNRND